MLAVIPAGLTNMAGWMASFFLVLVECSEMRLAIEALRIKEKEAEVAVRVRQLTSLRGHAATNRSKACYYKSQSGCCYDASTPVATLGLRSKVCDNTSLRVE